ncbi:MAG: hypothetical protein JGK01_29450 [Microcoleus sp. PH2017_03_ELD_O_A]|nr:hypothetical protein [Microcoleus sp. PH2017_03_ELD_O_A]
MLPYWRSTFNSSHCIAKTSRKIPGVKPFRKKHQTAAPDSKPDGNKSFPNLKSKI